MDGRQNDGASEGVRRRDLARLITLLTAPAWVLAGCGRRAGEAARPQARVSALPPPQRTGGMPLAEALAGRRSVRTFTDAPVGRAELGQLLWAAQGVTHGPGYRTAPSGGALYPLEIYVATRTTSLRYVPDGHRAEEWRPTSGWQSLVDATPSTQPVREAAAVFVVAGVVRRTAVKYGGRSDLYVQLEAGHAAQNLLLQATSLGLGAVPIGAYNPDRLARYFAMPPGTTPLYLLPVGRPAE